MSNTKEKSVAQINQEILDNLYEIRNMEKKTEPDDPGSIMDLINRMSRGDGR